MHELSYVEEVFKIVSAHAKTHLAKKVLSVNLVVSRESGIESDSFQFYWQTLTEHSKVLQSAKIIIRHTVQQMSCRSCQANFIPRTNEDQLIRCPFCDSIKTLARQDDTLKVESIKIET